MAKNILENFNPAKFDLFDWLIVALVTIFIVTAGFTNFFGLFSVLQGDGYILYSDVDNAFTGRICGEGTDANGVISGYCDSSFWGMNKSHLNGAGSMSGGENNASFSISATYSDRGSGSWIHSAFKRDISQVDFRAQIYYGWDVYRADGIFRVYLTNGSDSLDVFNFNPASGASANRDSNLGLLDVRKMMFANGSEVYFNGVKVGEVNFDKMFLKTELSVTGPSSGGHANGYINIEQPRYELPFSCELGEGDLLAFESFSGPRVVSIEDLRYPVQSFCLAHPAVITDAGENGSTSNAELYQLLMQGKSLSIPSDQVWGLFYVFDNSEGLVGTQCSLQEAYDVNLDSCSDLTGIVTVCSEGVFDAATGTCTVQGAVVDGDVSKFCSIGRYDITAGACVYNPPVEKVCEKGIWNDKSLQCEYVVSSDCPTGFEWSSSLQRCEQGISVSGDVVGDVEVEDQPGKLTWLESLIAVLAGAVSLIFRGTTSIRLLKRKR